jgi:OOP family OmpA-OmpF porin
MTKIFAAFCLALLFSTTSQAQNSTVGVKTIGFSIIANDFTSAQRIRSTSLASVLRQKQMAKVKDMDLGGAVTYTNGFSPHIDFAATLGGSFSKSVLSSTTSSEEFLLEGDVSARFKMFPNMTTVNPYLIAGVGASKYTNVYGAFIPLGGGFKFNLFNETFLSTELQYRIPVTTEANNYHFQISFGISGLIGSKKLSN